MKNCFHGCQQPAGTHLPKPHPQRLAVAQHLLGGGVGKHLRQHIVLEPLIVRGDDVLDLRAVLGLLQAQRVDQDALVGNGRRNALEFRQPAAAAGQLLEDGGRVKAGGVHLFERVSRGMAGLRRAGMRIEKPVFYTW